MIRLAIALILLACVGVSAQDSEVPITFDQVNVIAEKLYCPVCPNETLEDCQTQACRQWRAEIAEQLAAGQNEQQVIDSFVRRYGERVVAIPQDAGLRALSVVVPYLLAGAIALIGVVTLARWTRRRTKGALAAAPPLKASDDSYRAQMERDL